ncbi:FecR domain-containing protein [Pseudomonas sp. NPDC007930]|uniref:FecR domain-containing protein n=1 Tax=Pseudomonas sp. NPDC007930 TaxID=3364417 RepID=UPI0036E4F1DC
MAASDRRQALSAAAQWFARLGAAPADPALQQQWQQWHNACPTHQWAWQRLAMLQAQLGQAQGGLGYNVLAQAGAGGLGRRALLKGLVLGAGLGALGWGGYRQAPVWLADLRTGTGEQRSLRLADGSRLVLNTASAVDVDFTATARALRLRAGEVFIETAKDARPFTLSTGHGTLRALGTRFGARLYPRHTELAVFEHAVAVHPAHVAGEQAVIQAGQGVAFSADGVMPPRALAADEDAWVSGRLVIDGWRLDRLIAELQRYRPGYLGCAGEVGHWRVSGAYSLRDLDLTLAAVARALPVRVERYGPFWARVVPV